VHEVPIIESILAISLQQQPHQQCSLKNVNIDVILSELTNTLINQYNA
jgi:hypothetical protein